MELLQLKYFQKAAKTQNFTQAANELNISQPSLSITISRLEEELKINLFDRKGRNIELNEAGAAFLNRVNSVFCELDNAKNELAEIAGIRAKHIALSTTGSQLLSGILIDYIRQHHDVVINQRCGIYEEIKKQLVSGEIDFCVTLPAIQGGNIECRILKEDEIVLIVPNTHRFAAKKSIKLYEVADEDFIALPPNYNFRAVIDSICKAAGFSLKIVLEVDDILMAEMIEHGQGIALMPRYLADRPHEEKRNLSMVRIETPDPHIQIGLSWLKNKHFSITAKQFRDYIIENYK